MLIVELSLAFHPISNQVYDENSLEEYVPGCKQYRRAHAD